MIEARDGRIRHLDHGCLTTKAGLPIEERLATIFDFIADLIGEWKPAASALEGLFFWKNVTSAFPVAEAKGVIRLACFKAGLSLAEYSPTLIKQSVVGTSRADKEQVQAMVKLLLGLDAVPKPDHAADALAAAICRWHHEGPLSIPGPVPPARARRGLARGGPARGRPARGGPRGGKDTP